MSDGLLGLRTRALFGDIPAPHSDRGRALWVCRHLRALRSWITPGAYAWWRLTDDLKQAQRGLLRFRQRRA